MNRETGQCNIGTGQRRARSVMGWGFLAVSAAAAFWMESIGAGPGTRSLLFFPLLMAFLGFFQARARTCVFYAFAGKRHMDGRLEPVPEEEERKSLFSRGILLFFLAFLAAFFVTLLFALAR